MFLLYDVWWGGIWLGGAVHLWAEWIHGMGVVFLVWIGQLVGHRIEFGRYGEYLDDLGG